MEDALITKPQIALRYNKNPRTIERWLRGINCPEGFPQPLRINRRDFFKASEITKFEKGLKAK